MKKRKHSDGGIYFEAGRKLECFPSGCTLLDLVMGGGWPLGRVVNVVGDRSSGKTLIAMEACANFAATYPDGRVDYIEAEAAFDDSYANAIGIPMDRIVRPDHPIDTVEDLFDYLIGILKGIDDRPGLCIVDSLDSLSDRAEMARDMGEGTYGAEKAKKMSQLFRRLVREIGDKRICFIVISQIRDNMTSMAWGKKHTRSGGRALDFYASVILMLKHIGEIRKTRKKVRRTIGVNVKVKADKNKIGLPFREAEFPIVFNYGIDDLLACVDWLLETGAHKELWGSEKEAREFLKSVPKMAAKEYAKHVKRISRVVRREWSEIEKHVAPVRRKY